MILGKLHGYQAVWAYPDEYTEETIDAEEFYAIHTEHGTECKKCVNETKQKGQ